MTTMNIDRLKKQFLECPICHLQFNEEEQHPRVLSCLHSFCYSCLKQLIEKNDFSCPLCKDNFWVEGINVNQFPKDNTRRDLLDFVRAGDQENIVLCDECEERERAEYRCKECFTFLCSSCRNAHKRLKSTLGTHNVFSLDEVELTMAFVPEFRHEGKCPIHGYQEPLKLYCTENDCKKPVCHSCCWTNHKAHILRDIEGVYKEEVEKLSNIKKTQQQLDNLSMEIDQHRIKLAKNIKDTKERVSAIFQVAIEMLQRRQTKMIEEVTEIEGEKEKTLMEQNKEIHVLKESINDACEFLEQSLASKNPSAFLLLSQTISDRFDHLQNTKFHGQPRDTNMIVFQTCNMGGFFQSIVNVLGKVESATAYGPNTEHNFPSVIKRDKDFTFSIKFYTCWNAAIKGTDMNVTCRIYSHTGAQSAVLQNVILTEDENGSYLATCRISKDTQRLSKLCIQINSEDFHSFEIDSEVEGPDQEEELEHENEIQLEEDRQQKEEHQNEENRLTSEPSSSNSEVHNNKVQDKPNRINFRADLCSILSSSITEKDLSCKDIDHKGNSFDPDTIEQDIYAILFDLKNPDPDCDKFPISILKKNAHGNIIFEIHKVIHDCHPFDIQLFENIEWMALWDLKIGTEEDKSLNINIHNTPVDGDHKSSSNISLLNCKDCHGMCMNIFATEGHIISHQLLSQTENESIIVYVNRRKHYIAVAKTDVKSQRIMIPITNFPINRVGNFSCNIAYV